MATDLREEKRASAQDAATRRRRDKRDLRWPYVATAIVLVIVAAVTVLVLAGHSRPTASRGVWQRNIEGMMTDVREGSGYSPAVASEPITYANGALTGDREGSGFVTYVPAVTAHFPGHSFYGEGASTDYAEGASTEIREGAGFESLHPPRIGWLPGHGAYGAPTTDGRCP